MYLRKESFVNMPEEPHQLRSSFRNIQPREIYCTKNFFQILLESVTSTDSMKNYCSLAIGTVEERRVWSYLSRRMISLCMFILSEFDKSRAGGQHIVALTSLAMRFVVVLTDLKDWKSITEHDCQSTDTAVKDLVWFTGSSEGGLYLCIRRYISTLDAPCSSRISVPCLTQRLPALLISAMRHKSILSPCFQTLLVINEQIHSSILRMNRLPFTLEQQRNVTSVLNTLVYNGFSQSFGHQDRPLMESAIRYLHLMYERDCRHQFCPLVFWLSPARKNRPPIVVAARTHEVLSANVRSDDAASVPSIGSVITTTPHVFPFEERVEMFREFIKMDKASRKMAGEVDGPGSRSVEIVVRHGHIVEDGFRQLNSLGSGLKSSIHVSFVSECGLPEAGLDYGGLSKEFLTDISKPAFAPEYGLFSQTSTSDRLLIPNSSARYLENGFQMIEFLGRVELCLDFTVTEESFGKRHVIELKPDGKDVTVTNKNKMQYIRAIADYKLNPRIFPFSNAFHRGLTDLISPSWLKLFNAGEFNQPEAAEAKLNPVKMFSPLASWLRRPKLPSSAVVVALACYE
ncbi:hypothetical protein ACE6H2_021246 [Prunus campanulata]